MFGKPRRDPALEKVENAIEEAKLVMAATSEADARQRVEYATKLRSADARDILLAFSRLEGMVNSALQAYLTSETDTEGQRQSQRILHAFKQVRTRWLMINRSALTDEDAAAAYRIFHLDIPEATARIAKLSISLAPSGILEYTSQDWVRIYSRIDDIIEAQNSPQYGMAGAETPGRSITFPPLPSINPEVDESLAELHTLWVSAYGKRNTVEDEFFLEQVARSYLPDAWSLVGDLGQHSQDVQKQSVDLLLTQLTLMKTRTREILAAAGKEQVSALEAQTAFLRDRIQPVTHESRLRLEPGSSEPSA